MNKVQIIAEAGVNHNGEEGLALELIDKAIYCGADVIKFQTFIAKDLVSKEAKQAEYQKKNSKKVESQFDMLKRLELSHETFLRLKKYSDKKGIRFLSTAFDDKSLHFLVKVLKLDTLKIASGELTNAPFMLKHAKTNKKIILSTGMATFEEIEKILGVFAFGFINKKENLPSLQSFQNAYNSSSGIEALRRKLILMHCTTEYPTPYKAINLNLIDSLRDKFGLEVGFSDHSDSVIVPSLAVIKQATVIEKHLTLDTSMKGPDHKASLNPQQFKTMVDNIRIAELSLGSKEKNLTKEEFKNKKVSRKSVYAAKNIKRGKVFSENSISIKRPESAVSPFDYWNIVGNSATKDYLKGDKIDQ